MVLSLKDKWIWDFWLFQEGADWHVYFLQADNTLAHPDMRHLNVTQAHAVSTDLVNWTHKGTCLTPSRGPAFDDYTTWTGSVVKDDAGLYHLFYTGTSRADDAKKQRIGHATSTDLHSWQRVGDGFALDISGPDYEEYRPDFWHDRAFRDPWVIRDPAGDGWLMFMTARKPGPDEANACASIGLARSPDLYTWTLQPPVYAGGTFGQMEVPQVFEHDGRWYCLFCNIHQHWSTSYLAGYPGKPVDGTHYLMADNPLGPWTVAPGEFFAGDLPCEFYAGKVVKHDGKLFFMGFLDKDRDDNFIGKVSDPVPVKVDPATGLLSLDRT